MSTHIVHDSSADDTYRESPYTEHLTSNTPIWKWGAFEYEDMSVFAPLGTLGERRDLIATRVHAEIHRQNER